MNHTSAMTEQEKRRELNAIVHRVLHLEPLAKFEVFEALREDLASHVADESESHRQVRSRGEALDAMRKVARHIGLDDETPPSPKQFDRGAKELKLDWSSSRVTRAFERWRQATDAYLGKVPRETKAHRKIRQRRHKHHRSESDYLEGVRLWLGTSPDKETRQAHDLFVESYNAKQPAGSYLLSRSDSLRRMLSLGWPRIVSAAKSETTLAEAREQQLAEELPPLTKGAIIGVAAVARVLEKSDERTRELVGKDGFPVPVAHILRQPAWLLADIRAYKRGHAWPERQEGERQREFMDQREIESRLGFNRRKVQMRISARRWDVVPEPEGAVVKGAYYWRREKVERWLQTPDSI